MSQIQPLMDNCLIRIVASHSTTLQRGLTNWYHLKSLRSSCESNRMELLTKNASPTFSMVIASQGRESHCMDSIPLMCVCRLLRVIENQPFYAPYDSATFSAWIHSSGINCRWMGQLLNSTRHVWVRELVLSEIVGRTLKHILHMCIRSLVFTRAFQDNKEDLSAALPVPETIASKKRIIGTCWDNIDRRVDHGLGTAIVYWGIHLFAYSGALVDIKIEGRSQIKNLPTENQKAKQYSL